MTELSFLLELLLNHKLPKMTQMVIKDRIAEIQLKSIAGIITEIEQPKIDYPARTPNITTKELNARPVTTVSAPEQIAHTPAAQEALNNRQAMINAALNRKVMPGSDHAPKSHGKL